MVDAYPFRLSIITISHDHCAYLQPCLSSIYTHPPRFPFEVIVIDNVSSDGSSEMVRTQFPQVRLICNATRASYAANNNKGLRLAQGFYPMILNPDVTILPGALETLIDFMDTEPHVGLAGPKLLNPDLSLQHSCRRFATLKHILVRGLRLDRLLKNSTVVRDALYMDWDHNSICDVDYITGAAMITRRQALSEVGLLDDSYQLYVEDMDWCYRMWQHGWRVTYVPGAQMIHAHQRTSARKLWSHSTRTHINSVIRFFRKYHLPWPLHISAQEPRLK